MRNIAKLNLSQKVGVSRCKCQFHSPVPCESKQQGKVRLFDNHSEKLWKVLTILHKSNKPRKGRSKRGSQKEKGYDNFLERQSKVEELLSFDEETLGCARAEVERQIEDGRILVAILAAFGVVVGYLSVGAWLRVFAVVYFAILGIVTYIQISKRYLDLSLLKQALVLNDNCSVDSRE